MTRYLNLADLLRFAEAAVGEEPQVQTNDFPYRTLVVEAVLILLFAAYWIVQTVQLEDKVPEGSAPTPVEAG